jgi:purine nucleosidase
MRLVVDTDTGIDDALALLWLASRADVELVAVHSVHGNTSPEQAAANARTVLDLAGLTAVPVVGGRGAPVAAPAEDGARRPLHGYDGLGDCDLAPPPWPPAHADHDAVVDLLRLAHGRAGELDLLTLGPLTNVAAALRADPAILSAFRTVTVMGGTGRRMPGDDDPILASDTNTRLDADAARIVAGAEGSRVTMVGVDVTRRSLAGPAWLARLAATTTAHGLFAAAASRLYADHVEATPGERALPIHDALAAMVCAGADVDADFAEGECAVSGPAGRERTELVEPGAGAGQLRRALIGLDAGAGAELLMGALERPLPGARR